METQLQVFENPDFGDVRTIIRDGELLKDNGVMPLIESDEGVYANA